MYSETKQVSIPRAPSESWPRQAAIPCSALCGATSAVLVVAAFHELANCLRGMGIPALLLAIIFWFGGALISAGAALWIESFTFRVLSSRGEVPSALNTDSINKPGWDTRPHANPRWFAEGKGSLRPLDKEDGKWN